MAGTMYADRLIAAAVPLPTTGGRTDGCDEGVANGSGLDGCGDDDCSKERVCTDGRESGLTLPLSDLTPSSCVLIGRGGGGRTRGGTADNGEEVMGGVGRAT